MLRSAASPGSVGFGRFGGGTSGLLMTPLPTGHLRLCDRLHAIYNRLQENMMASADRGRLETTPCTLLDLGFAELDVLLRDRVILLLDQLVGHGARVLPRHVVEAGVGARHELHFDGGGLRHGCPRYTDVARNLAAHLPMSMREASGLKVIHGESVRAASSRT